MNVCVKNIDDGDGYGDEGSYFLCLALVSIFGETMVMIQVLRVRITG